MSSRTAGANRAIREAWENERGLVLQGKGTRDWTDEQQKQIEEKGKAYDGQGRAFEGQHMKSVSAYPEYQDDARNIQFLSREEHLSAHGGNWKNRTNGYYDPISKRMSDFGDGPSQPCAEAPLANPLYADPLNAASTQSSRAGSKSANALVDTTATPKGNLRQRTQPLLRFIRQALEDPRLRTAAAAVGIGVVNVVMDTYNRDRSPRGDRTVAPSTGPSTRMAPGPGADSLRDARQSPVEHEVRGHTKKDGTIVRPHPRGGKKD